MRNGKDARTGLLRGLPSSLLIGYETATREQFSCDGYKEGTLDNPGLNSLPD